MDAPFSLSLHQINERLWQFTVSGDVDFDTSPHLRLAIQGALDRQVCGVILDFRGVRYLDSSGMTVLLMAHRALRGKFVVLATSGAVTQVLRVTGLLGLIAVHDSLEALQDTSLWADLSGPSH